MYSYGDKNRKVHHRARPHFVMVLILERRRPSCSRLGGVSRSTCTHCRELARTYGSLTRVSLFGPGLNRRTSPDLGIVRMAKSALIREQNEAGSVREVFIRMDLGCIQKATMANPGCWSWTFGVSKTTVCSNSHQHEPRPKAPRIKVPGWPQRSDPKAIKMTLRCQVVRCVRIKGWVT